MLSIRSTTPLALGVALLLAGCSGADQGEKTTTSSSSSALASSTSTSNDPEAARRADEAAKAGIDPADPPKPIASSTTAAVVKGDPKATLRIDLLGLKRQGKTVLANFGFTVSSTGGSEDERWIYDYLGGTSWNPQLVDSTNLKLHKVVRAGGLSVATAYQGAKFRPGQTLYAYAVFAAPPENVTTMDVMPSDNVPAIPGVPLS